MQQSKFREILTAVVLLLVFNIVALLVFYAMDHTFDLRKLWVTVPASIVCHFIMARQKARKAAETK